MLLGWATDVHFDHCQNEKLAKLFERLKGERFDALLLTGDLAEAHSYPHYLRQLAKAIDRPIYFVLGNHDKYFPVTAFVDQTPSDQDIFNEASDLFTEDPRIRYLTNHLTVSLDNDTALIGHDGWYDARNGNARASSVRLTDFIAIKEFRYKPFGLVVQEAQRRADEAAAYIKDTLLKSVGLFERLVVATHVPPWPESATYRGKESDWEWQPWMSSQAMGDAIVEVAQANPKNNFLVFCGHSHGKSDFRKLPNLRCLTGAAKYGSPHLQGIWDFSSWPPEKIKTGKTKTVDIDEGR